MIKKTICSTLIAFLAISTSAAAEKVETQPKEKSANIVITPLKNDPGAGGI